MAGRRTGPTRTPASTIFDIARQDPPSGVSPDDAVEENREVLDLLGDTCPECPVYRLAGMDQFSGPWDAHRWPVDDTSRCNGPALSAARRYNRYCVAG